jgi:membrane associated rhomboid family serine protease
VVRVFFTDAGLFWKLLRSHYSFLPEGCLGITSPLLHGNIDHIIGNSIPIAALMFLLYQFYPLVANKVFIIGWLATGLLVWLLPPIDIFTGDYMYTCTIGASGVVYVLAFFLFSAVFSNGIQSFLPSQCWLYYIMEVWSGECFPKNSSIICRNPVKFHGRRIFQELL